MKNLMNNLIISISLVFIGIVGTLLTSIVFKIDYSKDEKVNIVTEKEILIKEIEVPTTPNGVCLIGKFGNPVSDEYMSRISSQQGLRNEIELNGGGSAGRLYHNAIDISMPEGTRINSTKDGIVTNVYPSYYNGGAKYKGHPTYGGLVEIQHDDGTKTLYAHLSMTLVREGDFVKMGQKIGESGGVSGKRGSGVSTGPHLHYSIILDINSFTTNL